MHLRRSTWIRPLQALAWAAACCHASEPPLVPPPADLALPAEGAAVLVRLDSLTLGRDDVVVQRWYRLLRAGPDGALGGLPRLLDPGSGASLRVLRARRLGPVPRDLPWHLEAPSPEATGRRLAFRDRGLTPGELVEVLLERRIASELEGRDLSGHHAFGLRVPVGLDVFEARVPASRPLRYLARGLGAVAEPVVSTEDGSRVLRWRIPAPLEGLAPEARPYVRVTGLESWEAAAAWYRPRWQARLRPGPRLRVALADRPARDWRARLAAEVAAVTTLPYRHRADGSLRDWMGRPAEEVHRLGQGNCADKANLLVARLSLRGIQAEPVVLAGDPARPLDPEVPTFQPGDHVLVRVRTGAGALWVDPTEPGYTLGELPPERRCQLAWAPLAGELIRSPPGLDGIQRRLDASLDPDGSLRGRYRLAFEGRAAARMRRAWAAGHRDLRRWLPPRAQVLGELAPAMIDLTRPLELAGEIQLTVPRLPEVGFLLRPPLPAPRAREEAPFGELEEVAHIAIPAELEIASLPAPVYEAEDGSRFRATWNHDRGGIRYQATWSGDGGTGSRAVSEARELASRATARILPRTPSSP
jgi:hypothetical protein